MQRTEEHLRIVLECADLLATTVGRHAVIYLLGRIEARCIIQSQLCGVLHDHQLRAETYSAVRIALRSWHEIRREKITPTDLIWSE